MSFVDEYDKFISHQQEMLGLYQEQLIFDTAMLAEK